VPHVVPVGQAIIKPFHFAPDPRVRGAETLTPLSRLREQSSSPRGVSTIAGRLRCGAPGALENVTRHCFKDRSKIGLDVALDALFAATSAVMA
jgi:hypothetical protein